MKKIVSWILLTMLLVSTTMLAFHIQVTNADVEIIYINVDGSISPSTAPINTLDKVTYFFIDNVNEAITVQRNNIIIDGNGHNLTPALSNDYGFNLTNADNVTITNTTLTASSQNTLAFLMVNTNNSQIVSNSIAGDPFDITFLYGISLTSCFSNNLSNNRDTGTTCGIVLNDSCNNVLSNNHFDNGIFSGVLLYSSNNNTLSGNHVSGFSQFAGQPVEGSFELSSSDNNTIIGNVVSGNGQGILLEGSGNNVLIANNVTQNVGEAGGGQINPSLGFGIYIESSSNNTIYHNNFVGNIIYEMYNANPNVPNNVMSDGSPNMWDNGTYGNYWSDYNGTDANHDGIGDTPYIIDANNTDNYPLITQYVIPEFPSFLILPMFMIVTLLAVRVSKKKGVKTSQS